MISFLRKYWPSMVVVAVILYATLSPDPTPDVKVELFPHADKLIHAIMFGGLTGAIAFDIQRDSSSRILTRGLMARVAVGTAIFGLADECAQAWLTDVRSGDFLDWLADVAGIIVAYFTAPSAIYKVLKRYY